MNEYSATDQPDPIQNDKPACWDLVMQDMKDRDSWGRKKYGTPLQPFNGRLALVDFYQEILDAAVYCRQKIEEDTIIANKLLRVLANLNDFANGRDTGTLIHESQTILVDVIDNLKRR